MFNTLNFVVVQVETLENIWIRPSPTRSKIYCCCFRRHVRSLFRPEWRRRTFSPYIVTGAAFTLFSPANKITFCLIPWSYKYVARSSQRPTTRLGKFVLEIKPLVLKSYQKNLSVCWNSFSHLYRLLLSWVVTYTVFHWVCLVVALFVQKRSLFPLLFGFILILRFVW